MVAAIKPGGMFKNTLVGGPATRLLEQQNILSDGKRDRTMMSQQATNAMNYVAPDDPNSPANKRKAAEAMNAAPAAVPTTNTLGS